MSAHIQLRSYTAEDFETLWAIDQACYEAAIAYSRRELRNYLRFPGAECLVAEAREMGGDAENKRAQIVGFCVTAQRGAQGYIVTMDVLAEWRRQGVARALLRDAEQRMAEEGVREVGLETAVENEAGVAFWKNNGYRSRGVRKGYYPGGRDAYEMVKTLKSARGRTAG